MRLENVVRYDSGVSFVVAVACCDLVLGLVVAGKTLAGLVKDRRGCGSGRAG